MKNDKLKICILEILLIFILFFALFAPNVLTRIVLSIVILIYAIIVTKSLKRRKTESIFNKQVMAIMIIFALIYIGIFYLMGLYFGFVSSKIKLSLWTITNFIIPLTIIIISTEKIRKIFLSQQLKLKIKSKQINLSLILTYISTVLIDLLIYTGIYDLNNLDNFLTALGFVLFASLSCNLLYNYISSRYNIKSIIVYRLITTLFIYVIPITPNVYIFFRSFLRMLYPYIIYLILEKMFSQNDFSVSYAEKKKDIIGNTIILIIVTLIIMLISCQFKYGMIVIGSESMKGTIDRADAIIYESYDNQIIKEGEIIIFNYNNIKVVHRVIEIKEVNGFVRYYTKGDANKNKDAGYITKKDIIGIVKLKVKYIGYPTLWLKEAFE